jgi:hypothetical protein
MVAVVVSLSRRRLPSSLMAVRAEDSSTMVVPEPPGFDAIVPPIDASAVVHTRSSSRRTPDPLTAGLSRNAHHLGS